MLSKSKTLTFAGYSAFSLTVIVLLSCFIDEKFSRITYYFDSYVCIIGMLTLCFHKLLKKEYFNFSLPFFIMGLTFFSWSYLCSLAGGKDFLLFLQAKRYFLSFFIITFLIYFSLSDFSHHQRIKLFAKTALWLAFICSSLYAVFQSIGSSERVLLGIDQATMSAYAYSFLSLSLLMQVIKISSQRIKTVAFIVVSSISIYVIYHTQTRAAMGVHTLILFLLAAKVASPRYKPLSFILIISMLCLSVLGNWNIISHRSSQALSDIHQYDARNDKTSLGARFTMWKVGLVAFEHRPLGETLNHRNAFITEYLALKGEKRSDALKYLDIHLHNEFIQYASTFGIIGILVMLYFYYSFILKTVKFFGRYNLISIPMIALLIYGITDVVFVSAEMIVIFSCIITFNLIIMLEKSDNR